MSDLQFSLIPLAHTRPHTVNSIIAYLGILVVAERGGDKDFYRYRGSSQGAKYPLKGQSRNSKSNPSLPSLDAEAGNCSLYLSTYVLARPAAASLRS